MRNLNKFFEFLDLHPCHPKLMVAFSVTAEVNPKLYVALVAVTFNNSFERHITTSSLVVGSFSSSASYISS